MKRLRQIGATSTMFPPSLAVILIAFVLIAVLYSVLVPLWEAPDEPEHFQYIVYLIEHHQLPDQLPSIQTDGNNEGKQPPLYYLLALPFVQGVDVSDAVRIRINPHAGWQGMPDGMAAATHVLDEGWPLHGSFLAAHLVRLYSILLGTLNVYLIYLVALAFTSNRATSITAAALAAFLPGYLFSSATIDNDILGYTIASGLLLIALRTTPENAPRRAYLFGIVGAAGMLAKLTIVPALAVCGWSLLLETKREDRLTNVIRIGVPLLVPLLYWWRRVGTGDKLLIGRPVQLPPWLMNPATWDGHALIVFAQHFWTSFFGVFSWSALLMPLPLYLAYSLAYGAGGVAAVVLLLRPSEQRPQIQRPWFLLALPLIQLSAMLFAAAMVTQSQGYDHARLFYPALAAVATLIAYGWTALFNIARETTWTRASALALAGGTAALVPVFIIRPVYAPSWQVSDVPPTTATPLPRRPFLNSVTLVADQFPAGTVGAGQGFYVWFYWQVQQPLPPAEYLFIHVANAAGAVGAALDTQPSSATLPLTYWRPGDVIYEREVLTTHQDAASGAYAVKLGWYDHTTGARIGLVDGGSELTIGTLHIVAQGQ